MIIAKTKAGAQRPEPEMAAVNTMAIIIQPMTAHPQSQPQSAGSLINCQANPCGAAKPKSPLGPASCRPGRLDWALMSCCMQHGDQKQPAFILANAKILFNKSQAREILKGMPCLSGWEHGK